MRVRHLGLPVRDVARSLTFYETWFGFPAERGRTYPDSTVIVRDEDGFDLALHPVAEVDPLPAFLHFGFRLAGPDDVRDLRVRLIAADVPIVEWDDEDGYTAFKCLDPDGHRIEVYWEP